MTEMPNPEEYRRQMAHVDRDFATARRLLVAMRAEDSDAKLAILTEVSRSGRGSHVLVAMAIQCLDFADALDHLGVLDGGVQAWLERAALRQLDVVEQDQKGSDGNSQGE